jgi:hypothetical protein
LIWCERRTVSSWFMNCTSGWSTVYTSESTIDYMRYDLRADRWPTDPNEAAVRNGDVFHALAMRGVVHNVALMRAERLEQGDTIEASRLNSHSSTVNSKPR